MAGGGKMGLAGSGLEEVGPVWWGARRRRRWKRKARQRMRRERATREKRTERRSLEWE